MSLATRLTDLAVAVGTDIKQIKVWLFGSSSGSLSDLQTTAKGSIVAAINEARTTGGSGTPPNASETVVGVVELATLAEVATGTDSTRAVTAAAVRQERNALKTEILGGATGAFDTLMELKALVDGAEESADITALTTVVGGKADKSEIYTRTQLGDPDTDFAAAYATAKA